nr:hypothetical protein Iba_chr04fCG11760 [Ipomoea batatas]
MEYAFSRLMDDLIYSTSLQQLSSTTSAPSPLKTMADSLEVYTTLFTVPAFTHSSNIRTAPLTASLYFASSSSSGSSRSGIGCATWNTPTHPSIAGEKLSGLSRSATKIRSLSGAPSRLVRKLASLGFPPGLFLKIGMDDLSSKLATPNASCFHLLRNSARDSELLCFTWVEKNITSPRHQHGGLVLVEVRSWVCYP